MSAKYIPGTNLPLNNETSMMFSNIDVLFSAAKGLSLSQVTSISGLPASTVQNWVKRGWIKVTNGKKYEEASFSRILIINILRDTIQLDKIDDLLNFVCNKSAESGDDIIEEQHWQIHTILKKSDTPNIEDRQADDIASVLVSWFNGPGCDELRKHGVANTRIDANQIIVYNDDSGLYQKRAVFTVKLQVPKELSIAEVEMAAIKPKLMPI